MKLNIILMRGIILCIVCIMVGTPFVQAASTTSGTQTTMTTSQIYTMLKEKNAEGQALNNQQVAASVDRNYKNLEAMGAIPVVSGPAKFSVDTSTGKVSITLSNVSSNVVAMDAPVYPPMMAFCHDQGYNYWGAVPLLFEQIFNPSNAACYRQKNCATPAGYGGNDAWVWTGLTFVWGGSTGYHNIIVTGYENGVTNVAGTASASTSVDVVVQDNTNGASDSRNQYSATPPAPFACSYDNRNINQMMGEYLTNGNTYTIYVKLTTAVSLWGSGTANTDYDWGNGGIWLDGVQIT